MHLCFVCNRFCLLIGEKQSAGIRETDVTDWVELESYLSNIHVDTLNWFADTIKMCLSVTRTSCLPGILQLDDQHTLPLLHQAAGIIRLEYVCLFAIVE